MCVSQVVRQPFVLGGQALFERHCRVEPEIRARERRVGIRVPHVALLCGIRRDERPTARYATNDLEHVIERDARPAANIVYAPRYPAGGGGNGFGDRGWPERACGG